MNVPQEPQPRKDPPQPMSPHQEHSHQAAIGRWWMPTLFGSFCLMVLFIFFQSVLGIYLVPSESMVPTIVPGDRIVVDRLAYGLRWPLGRGYQTRWSLPQEGDIVVFQSPWDTNRTFVKRVVRNEHSPPSHRDALPIPSGFIFCEGDNREASFDSRNWGLVSIELVYGKVVLVLFSTGAYGLTGSLPQFRPQRWLMPL